MNRWENYVRSSLNSLNKQRLFWFYYILVFFGERMNHTFFSNVELLYQQKYFMCVQRNPIAKVMQYIVHVFPRIFQVLLSFGSFTYLFYTLSYIIWFVYIVDKQNIITCSCRKGLLLSHCDTMSWLFEIYNSKAHDRFLIQLLNNLENTCMKHKMCSKWWKLFTITQNFHFNLFKQQLNFDFKPKINN